MQEIRDFPEIIAMTLRIGAACFVLAVAAYGLWAARQSK